MPRGTKQSTATNLPGDPNPPKNGWLVVGVLCSILAMISLAIADFYLIRHPSVSVKLFGPSETVNGGGKATQEKSLNRETPREVCATKPEVTFYTRLSGSSDPAAAEGKGHWGDKDEKSVDSTDPAKRGAKEQGTESSREPRLNALNTSNQPLSSERSLPEPQRGTPVYTVQVGAFTQPGIAQEWAAKWKARGYEVVLRPVARPKAGIIYRLYLGSFSSERSAEDLVKHLKVKEGISAFTLVLRN